MSEREKQPFSPKGLVGFINSDEFLTVFKQISPQDRAQVVLSLVQAQKNLTDTLKDLTKQEELRRREELGLVYSVYELSHPEDIIIRLFRKGKYLDFSELDEFVESRLPLGVRRLVDEYKEHIGNYGEESVAHLGLSSSQFWNLTKRKIFISESDLEPRPHSVNTISELRDVLSGDVQILILSSHIRTLFYRRLDSRNIKGIKTKLAQWDAIDEQSEDK